MQRKLIISRAVHVAIIKHEHVYAPRRTPDVLAVTSANIVGF